MAFFEHYTNSATGDNTAGGSSEGAPVFSLTNGDWNATTGVFVATGQDLSAVVAGMSASVYIDGASVGVFVGRITAVDDTADTITVSTTAKSGTAPTTSATARTIKVGGAWKGPNAAESFPFGFVQNTLTDASSNTPRINKKNNATYSITAAMTHSNAGPTQFQGYTTTVGDGGRATIDGGTSGASYTLLTTTGGTQALVDLIFQNNGATGSATGVLLNGSEEFALRLVVHDVRGIGLSATSFVTVVECETYACNQSNTSDGAGFVSTGDSTAFIRCIAHDNAGSNTLGFRTTSAIRLQNCVADTNGKDGAETRNNSSFSAIGCDFYNNGSDGIELGNASSAAHVYIENCNFVKNGGWGINGAGSAARIGAVVNCGFGSGTQANTSGTTTGLKSMVESGSVTYPADVTPWVDPAAGDFRISLPQAKGAGRGAFTQTAAGYAGAVGYPDIGAVQSQAARNNTSMVLM